MTNKYQQKTKKDSEEFQNISEKEKSKRRKNARERYQNFAEAEKEK